MGDALDSVKAEMEPLLERLVLLTEEEAEPAQRDFFAGILRSLRASRDLEDVAEPFMQLSTAAFLGFHYSFATQLLLDRALEAAQTVAMTLSAETRNPS